MNEIQLYTMYATSAIGGITIALWIISTIKDLLSNGGPHVNFPDGVIHDPDPEHGLLAIKQKPDPNRVADWGLVRIVKLDKIIIYKNGSGLKNSELEHNTPVLVQKSLKKTGWMLTKRRIQYSPYVTLK